VTGEALGQGLAARAAAWYGRATAWYAALPPRRRELAQDTGLALALAVLNLLSLLPYRSQLHPSWLALFLAAAQCIPLAWRRRWPVPALICSGIPRNAYDALLFGYAPLPLAPAIAFATVAERSGRLTRWIIVVLVAIGIVRSQMLPGHTQPYDTIVQVFIFGTAWAIGMLGRVRRESMAAVARRAERAEAELDAAAARSAAAAAAERARIARELHDVVAHHVSLMAVQAEAVGALLPGRPDAAAQSADLIAATARQAMAELRRLLGVLRFNPADHSERTGLAPAASLTRIEEVLSAVRGAGLPVSYSVSGSPAPLPPGVDLTAYRIVQEALTNALRHAPGSRACVDVRYEESFVTVRVTDTGARIFPEPPAGPSGAAAHEPPAGPSGTAAHEPPAGPSGTAAPEPPAGAAAILGLAHGFGIAGIAERVASCGGSLTVGPQSRGGFAVTARLPVV
jgi:signal transduction histidine kinase